VRAPFAMLCFIGCFSLIGHWQSVSLKETRSRRHIQPVFLVRPADKMGVQASVAVVRRERKGLR
jgi:hypothetical protein